MINELRPSAFGPDLPYRTKAQYLRSSDLLPRVFLGSFCKWTTTKSRPTLIGPNRNNAFF